VIVDRGHRGWAVFAVLFAAASLGFYLWYAGAQPGGPKGGTWIGLGFGIVGSALMLFALLLGARKRRPHWRLGRAAWWLKGHLWLGALSLPLILFHGGFRFGGTFTQVLMWIFVAVFATGLWGLALQQFMPRLMTKNLPLETIYEQADYELEHLIKQAEKVVTGEEEKGKGRARPRPVAKAQGAVQGKVVRGAPAAEPEAGEEAEKPVHRGPLRDFLRDRLRSYFEPDGARRSPLYREPARKALFEELRRVADARLADDIATLEALCEQRSQIELQSRMHRWLHGWLLIHVPLSYALVLLGAVHAVMALYY